MNKLYYGDCLTIMQEMAPASVDLIYLDPPFNSNREYNAIYKDGTGRPLPDQIAAFCDLWELNEERERAIRAMPVLMRKNGLDDHVAEFWTLWMNALRKTNQRLLAYLSYMMERLIVMRGLLCHKGSIYLHCDPTASHYLKVMMDTIFGYDNFKNEVVWRRATSHNDAKRYGKISDRILFYVKSRDYTWNGDVLREKRTAEELRKTYSKQDARGFFRIGDITGPAHSSAKGQGESTKPWEGYDVFLRGRVWSAPKRGDYADFIEKHFIPRYKSIQSVHERLDALDAAGLIHHPDRGFWPGIKRYSGSDMGIPPQDIFDAPIGFTNYSAKTSEYLGYATQKPLALLERIIKASSNKGDMVFDPFCGCATTLEAAHNLGRKWIGIDIAIHAIKRVAKVRLGDRCGLREGADYEIEGVPRTLEGAKDLWERDKYHFQKWVVEQVDGFVTTKRTADGGIDGRLYFVVPGCKDLQSMILEVKGGKNVSIAYLRALRGVMETGNTATMAGLIIMGSIGKTQERNFHKFMAQAGDLDILGVKYPKMQMIAVPQILEGERFATPSVAGRGSPQLSLSLGSSQAK